MPLPTFASIDACMASDAMKGEFPDKEQRFAVCRRQVKKPSTSAGDKKGGSNGGGGPSIVPPNISQPGLSKAMRRRRITAAKITHISLVPRGANRMPVIFKADDQTLDVELLVKASDDFDTKGELTALVYAPEQRDSQGDIASADVIKEMMYDAARDGVSIDVRHDGVALAKEQAFVAESFLVQKDDPRFEGIKTYDGVAVDPVGSWGVVMKVDDPALRQKYRDGEWNGVSMGGTAVVASEKSDDMLTRVIDEMAKRFGVTDDANTNEDFDMTKDEMAAALKESNADLAKSIVEGVGTLVKEHLNAPPEKKGEAKGAETTKAETKEPPKKPAPKAPVFKGDPTDPEALMKHQRALALFNLRKDVDWDDAASVAEYTENLAAFKEEFGELTEDDKATVNGKPKKPATNQPVGTAKEGEPGHFEGVSKEDTELAKIGSEMAEWSNKQRGMATATA